MWYTRRYCIREKNTKKKKKKKKKKERKKERKKEKKKKPQTVIVIVCELRHVLVVTHHRKLYFNSEIDRYIGE